MLEKCVATVFSEPQVDDVLEALPQIDGAVFAAEYLPGQFDQRADSASQCVQFVSGGAARSYARRRCIFWRAI